MLRSEEAYKTVEELRKKHPEDSLISLIKKAGFRANLYYDGRRRAGVTGKRKKTPSKKPEVRSLAKPDVKYTRETVPAPKDEGKVIMVMGTPQQIREMLK